MSIRNLAGYDLFSALVVRHGERYLNRVIGRILLGEMNKRESLDLQAKRLSVLTIRQQVNSQKENVYANCARQ